VVANATGGLTWASPHGRPKAVLPSLGEVVAQATGGLTNEHRHGPAASPALS